MSKPEEGKQEPASNGPEVGEMRKGDYMIHVFLQQGKQFKLPGLSTVQPIVEITCCGKKKYSQSKPDVSPNSTVYWGEHIFFEPTNQSKSDIEGAQIQIRVLNKGILKDDTIGVYDIDVTYVYFQKKHAMFHQWIAFSNPEGSDFNEITCYLKLSISVQGPGDEQVQLTENDGLENSEEQEVMMPASIKKEFKQLKFRFVKAEKLPKMDQFGTIDAYVQTTFMKKKLKTKAVTQTKTHETFIEQEFWLPIQWPMATDRLVLKVYDEDKLSDEIVGSMYFSVKKIVETMGQEGKLVWRNLYGSPLGCTGENTARMNDYPEMASTWKGRILTHISVFDTKAPEMKVAALDADFKQQCLQIGAFDSHEFEIIAEVGAGICLPGKKNFTVKIQVNDFFLVTQKPKEQKPNYCRWSERFPVTAFKGPYKSVEELNRVYVYLMDGDDALCYWKGMVTDFMDPNPKYKWLPMTCDLALGKVTKSYEAGLIQVKMSFNHKTKNGPVDFSKLEAWKKPPPKRLRSWKIRCFIFQCKDIPSADNDGASDPYISLWNPDNKEVVTQTIYDNTNPIYFEALEVYYDFDTLNDAPPIVLNIWDKDEELLDSTDDYLGRCVVYLNNAAVSNDDRIPEPRWHDIRIGFSDKEPACGQMLVSFSLVEDDYTYKIPITYLKLTEEIEYKEYQVEINILGLRNLESFGLMPVKKPFIKFNLRSLLPPEKAQAVTNIKTNPSATGSNPNINTMINFQIDLPVNPLFCPKLACDVYDYVYKGLMQPLLGTFSISIGEMMQEQTRDRERQLKESEEIMAYLKQLQKQIEVSVIYEEEAKLSDFSRRAKEFDSLASQSIDSSRVVTEGQDQQRLIGEGPHIPKADEEPLLVEEVKIEEPLEKGEEEEKTESPAPVSKEVSPLRQQAAMIAKQKAAKGAMFKQESNKVQQDMETGLTVKYMMMKQQQKEEDAIKLEQKRLQDKEAMKSSGEEIHRNVLLPKYQFDDRLKMNREVSKPPSTIYMELGHNEEPPAEPEQEKKHYRKYFSDELENNREIFAKMPFHTTNVIRGQSRGLSKGFFSFFKKTQTDDSGEISNLKVVGQFKGRITIENKAEKDNFKATRDSRVQIIFMLLNDLHEKKFGQPLQITLSDLENYEKAQQFQLILENLGAVQMDILGFLREQSYAEMLTRQLLTKTKCIVRLYMIEGYDFAQRDIGSHSDPYLKVKLGKKKYNERDNYQLDEPNPKFYKMYEFDAEFPGAPPLVIKAYDYDDLFGDDLIGKTTIDLDDRFFCPEWQNIDNKPIEFRQLYHSSSSNSQGVVKCWVEIHRTAVSTKASENVWDIAPAPLKDYQVRVVIWDTKDIIAQDIEGTSDVFIKAYIDSNDKKETDTHFRCQNGKASFNYRLLFDMKAPAKNYNFTLQTWDRDLFKSNDFIGETQFSLKDAFEDAILTKKPISITKKYYNQYLREKLGTYKLEFYDEDSFYVNTLDKDGKYVGKVRIGISITPGEHAKSNPVGHGRTEPNQSPFLPPPVGRISFSLNPFTMLNQLVGPELRRKIYMYCCIAFCAVLCIACIPMVFSDLISQAILKIF